MIYIETKWFCLSHRFRDCILYHCLENSSYTLSIVDIMIYPAIQKLVKILEYYSSFLINQHLIWQGLVSVAPKVLKSRQNALFSFCSIFPSHTPIKLLYNLNLLSHQTSPRLGGKRVGGILTMFYNTRVLWT